MYITLLEKSHDHLHDPNSVLKTGVGVGVKEWLRVHGDHVKSEAIEKAITQIMMGEETKEMRSRAKKLGETTRKAVE